MLNGLRYFERPIKETKSSERNVVAESKVAD